jgi:hypothetical protein
VLVVVVYVEQNTDASAAWRLRARRQLSALHESPRAVLRISASDASATNECFIMKGN